MSKDIKIGFLKQVVMTPVEVTTIQNIELVLTPEEFTTLAVILSRIGGCPVNSPRKYAKSVLQKIISLIPRADRFSSAYPDSLKGSISLDSRNIYFNDGLKEFNSLLELVKTDLLDSKPV